MLSEPITHDEARYFASDIHGHKWIVKYANQCEATERILTARLAEATALAERTKLEAQIHAQEARAQRATVHECYRAVTGGTGEPADWNGSRPVVECITKLRARLATVEAQRDTLVPLAQWIALPPTADNPAFLSDSFFPAARATLTAIAAEAARMEAVTPTTDALDAAVEEARMNVVAWGPDPARDSRSVAMGEEVDALIAAVEARAAAALDAEAARREAGEMRVTPEMMRQAMADADSDPREGETFCDQLAESLNRQLTTVPATPHAELRGWGVMRPDGTLLNLWHFFPDAPREEAARLTLWTEKPHRAVPVRLTTEAPDAK